MDPVHLSSSFRRAVKRIDYSSASLKINLAVSELPDFTCLPGNTEVGPQHRGTIHIGASPEYLERAYDDAKYGRPSQRPIVEMTIPTSLDPGFPISLWYLTARTSRRALISGAPTQGPSLRRVTPGG